jgi:putative transposase
VKTFRLVDEEREHHAVSLLCAVLRVTRQGYYAWRRREATPGPRRQADQVYCGAIMRLYTKSRETYGAPRITARLRIEEGIRIGQKRAARLMRELGIKGVARGKKHPRTTVRDVKAPPAPDLIERDFTASGPDQKWCADITYVETREGYLFLAVVSDVFSRRIVGWSMRDNLEAEIVADAVAMSVARRRPQPGVIHHSDRGSQYTSVLAGRTLRESGLLQSMGSVGDPWDNALQESGIGTIKAELVSRHDFASRTQARLRIFDYIENFYNPIRAHSSLSMLTPDEYETAYHQSQQTAKAA